MHRQISSVNAHAEELRSKFVAHEGKQDIQVSAVGTRYTVDFGALAQQITKELHKKVRIKRSLLILSLIHFMLGGGQGPRSLDPP